MEQSTGSCSLSAETGGDSKTHLSQLKAIESSELFPVISTRLKEIEISSEYAYVDSLERIANYLVESKQMSAQDAQIVFSEKVLSDYAMIFFKFTLAELYSRDFDKKDVQDLLESFSGLLDRVTQIEFATAVAERMLLLINDRPGIRSPAGLRQFKAMAKTLGVSETTYKSFLGMWRYLIATKTDMVLEYTLIQLKSLSEAILIEKQRIEDELQLEKANASRWRTAFGLVKEDKAPERSYEVDLNIDKNLLVLGPFELKEKKEFSYLQRYLGEVGRIEDVKNIREIFDTVPILVIDHILQNSMDQMSFPILMKFSKTKEFRSLSDDVQDAFKLEIDGFLELKTAISDLKEKINNQGFRPTIKKQKRLIDVHEVATRNLVKYFDYLKTSKNSINSASQNTPKLRQGYKDILSEVNIQENPQYYYDILFYVITEVLSSRKFNTMLQALEYLSMESLNFMLSQNQKKNIIKAIEHARYLTYEVDEISGTSRFGKHNSIERLLSSDSWGMSGKAKSDSIKEDLTEEKGIEYFSDDLIKIQDLLAKRGEEVDFHRLWTILIESFENTGTGI
ncbi:MAG: hypothetical protein VX642_04060 [Bdellovibrionota bacterium]|nr:hypothetical protein [Bdellovibrionota bacterium]